MNSGRPVILGHRGFRGPIENTPTAFRRALRYADGIEFDVRVTGDGKVVIHHDDTFWSNGSLYRLRDLSIAELKRLHPLGSMVPTMERVLKEFSGALFDVDVKEPEAVEGALKIVERRGATERAVFSADDPGITKTLLRECPDCRVGFSVIGYPSVPWIARFRGLHSIHVPIDAVSYVGYRPLVVLLRALRKRGLRIYLWNYMMDELTWVPRFLPSVDVVISDDPARLRKTFYAGGVSGRGDAHVGEG